MAAASYSWPKRHTNTIDRSGCLLRSYDYVSYVQTNTVAPLSVRRARNICLYVCVCVRLHLLKYMFVDVFGFFFFLVVVGAHVGAHDVCRARHQSTFWLAKMPPQIFLLVKNLSKCVTSCHVNVYHFRLVDTLDPFLGAAEFLFPDRRHRVNKMGSAWDLEQSEKKQTVRWGE